MDLLSSEYTSFHRSMNYFKRRVSLKQGYRYHKFRGGGGGEGGSPKFYHWYHNLMWDSNFCLNIKGLYDIDFYRDLMYKFRKFVGLNEFSAQFRKITILYKKKSGTT